MQHSWCKSQNTQVVGSAKKNINYILNSDFFLYFFFFFFLRSEAQVIDRGQWLVSEHWRFQ